MTDSSSSSSGPQRALHASGRSSSDESSRLEAQGHSASKEKDKEKEELESLRDTAVNPALSEDMALAMLNRRELSVEVLTDLAKNTAVMKSRRVRLALVIHQKTPRHISLPLLRQLFTFDMMQVALTPAVAADLKFAAEAAITTRLKTIATGERLTLARRGSARIAAALLNDTDKRVMEAALNNPFLTEAWVVKALVGAVSSQILAPQVSTHPKWPLRREVRMALLRNAFTPMASAIQLAQSFSAAKLREILKQSNLPKNVKTYLLEIAAKRGGPQFAAGI